jgi:hypothetical protein
VCAAIACIQSIPLIIACHQSNALGAQVFYADFESNTLPAELNGPGGSIQGTQGFSAVAGGVFGSSFWRYDSTSMLPTTLSLTGLAPHSTVDVGFLWAGIDSLDNEGFVLTLDGTQIFSGRWGLSVTPWFSTYSPAPGVFLGSGNFGFTQGGYENNDVAYDFAKEPSFKGIPHSSSTLTLTWTLTGGGNGWEGGSNESMALDRIEITTNAAVPEPQSALLLGLGVGAIAMSHWFNHRRGRVGIPYMS